jgi:cellulose synthase/poly-beta-1,6-N-acetylglucosamine synthase-like glycosyltransferase
LAGIVASPLSSAALFVPMGRPRRTAGKWPAVRRFALALVGTAALTALVAGVLVLLNVSTAGILAAVAGLALASIVWLPATRRWNARGHLCWASTVFLFVAYLTFILHWTFASNLGVGSTIGGLLLWVFEVVAAFLACAYLWELCDALGTERWRRRITRDTPTPEPAGDPPMVSLQVPAHNEPPDMVIETLKSLLRIDYPRYEIIAIDDNTEDESLWRPVSDWCAANGVKFVHLEDWPGYKSGALNYALRELTDPAVDIIGVVDSDYQIDPGFLRRCAPLFADPRIGFIQAPQDYRDWAHTPYFRRLYYSYKYFFAVSQPSRNEHDGAIFAGTMGLIRREALEGVGAWDEWCITEDAELSLRLLRAGWSGLHVDQSWGRGVMPLTFEALKSQRYRWCFGGIQILRMHWRSLLRGGAGGPAGAHRSDAGSGGANRLSLAQRWAYLAGALQWYGDLLGLAFFVFLLVGAINLATGGDQLFRKLTAFLVATVPVLVALGLIRAVALLRRGTGASWRDAIGAFFVWQSTSLVVARASVQGLYAKEAAFLRTPKTSEKAAWWEAFRANWAESTLAVLGILGIVVGLLRYDTFSGPLLAGLLLFPTLGMAAAPLNSLAAQRAALSPQLRARQRTEWRRDRTVARGAAAIGATAAVATVMAAVVALFLLPGPEFVRPPDLLDPGPGREPTPAPSAPGSGGPGSVPGSVSPSGGGAGTEPAPEPTTGEPTTGPTPGPPTPTPTETSTPGDTSSS